VASSAPPGSSTSIPTHATTAARGGRYEPLYALGAGGMADVFLALAKGPFDAKKLVVLKRPRPGCSADFASMFVDEARLAMRLNHPNVVQTYEVGVEDGGFFLAMEFLEGQPLNQVTSAMAKAGVSLSHAHVARIASEALAGLHYAHELCDYDGTPLHIVHRDVSPQNLFVTYEGQVKVVDFGIAKAASNEVQTETGAIKGKLAYMSPEHATGRPVDRRADVFAMGVILWELVARRRLVAGASSAEILHRLMTTDFPPLSTEVPDVHPILEAIVMRALHRDPADRFPTALAMRDALESYITATGTTVRPSDIGRLVEELFSDARAQMSTRIRAHVQSSGASRAALPAISGSVPALPTAVTSAVDRGPASADTHGPSVVSHAPSAPAPKRSEWRTVLPLLALSGSILVLAVALVVTRRGATEPRAAAAATGASAGSHAPPPSAEPPVVATAAPAASGSASSAPVTSASATASPTTTARPRATAVRAASSSAPRGPAAPHRPIDTSFPR